MSDILEGLNEAQREAVTATEGFVRVIAGAGSGKTRALSRRFAYLVNEVGILPGSILCVTFTNKSANEMRRRIHNLIGDNDTGYVNTFHGFCVSILQEDSHALSYPKSFLVLDNSDVDSMLRIIYEERGLTLRDMTFSAARDMIEIRKCIKEPDYYEDMLKMSPEDLLRRYESATEASDIIFYGYLYQEKKCFALDYNDLINFSLYIFDTHPDIKLKWQKRLEYIMIDEFQDIDRLQYRLMEVLAGYHGNLFVVGDPDQTVYTWRGADVRYLTDFDSAFPNVKTVMMMKNYRSTPEIIAAANSLIDKNRARIKKELIPTLPSGEEVLCHHAEDPEAEAVWIGERIRELTESGARLKDIAILYRAHYVTRTVEDALLREKIPYTIYSGAPFFERTEIKDALSYLRLALYRDDISFMRVANVPKRNIGKRRMDLLREYAEANSVSLYEALEANLDTEEFRRTKGKELVSLVEKLSRDSASRRPSELLSDVLDQSGYEKMLRTEGAQNRLDNLAELRQSVYEYETSSGEDSSVESYLAHVSLFTNSDVIEGGDSVKLMTVHTAKGLEFPYVFLCTLNEGVFPSKKTSTLREMEEERRLAFVAVTRAQRRLYLSEAQGRGFDQSPRFPSRFILDIDPELICHTPPPRDSLIAETKEYIALTSSRLRESNEEELFAVGQRIRHAIFGCGTVTAVDTDRSAYTVAFDGMETPRSIAFRVLMKPL